MNYNDFVEFKGNGYYYNVYNDDAYIVAHIMGYKLYIKNGVVTAGFPCHLLNEVVKYLEKNRISYIVDDTIKDYGILNQYKKFVRQDIPITSTDEVKKIYSGKFSILFLGDEEVETFEIGKDISSDAEIVKIVYDNEIGSINTLNSGERFKIISKDIK